MMKGVCASGRGKLKGEVRIVEDPVKDYFEAGKIMVTPKTTADSIPYIKLASAVITNHGGRTSHAMIVCKENNIPCIIGTFNATKILNNGDVVELDFDTGEIKMLLKGKVRRVEETNEILELNYKKYKKVAEPFIEITDEMLDVAELNVFEMQKKFPDKLTASKNQIEQLKKDIQITKLPPIIIQVDEFDKFVTVVDGFHRIIAYRQLEIVRAFAIYVERIHDCD